MLYKAETLSTQPFEAFLLELEFYNITITILLRENHYSSKASPRSSVLQ